MIAITCEKCRRRFTPTVEEIQGDLAAAQGKKHALILCPYCGKANKVSPERLREALRFVPAAPAPEPEADSDSKSDKDPGFAHAEVEASAGFSGE